MNFLNGFKNSILRIILIISELKYEQDVSYVDRCLF